MKRSIVTNPVSINESKPGSGQQRTNTPNRRTLLGGALAAALLSSPGRVMAQGKTVPSDPFVLLLKGIYQPVVHGPNLGLSEAGINLNDGSYSTVKIYPVHIEGIPCGANEDTIGNFYVQFNGNLCAYQLPEGAIAMRFRACDGFKPGVSDGLGGFYLDATFELTILEATGIYRSFQGGHNHMEDRIHQLANGNFDEYCFCFISRR